MGVAGVREGFLDRLCVQITGVLSCRSSPGSQHVKSRTSRESSSSSLTGVRPASVFGPGPRTSCKGDVCGARAGWGTGAGMQKRTPVGSPLEDLQVVDAPATWALGPAEKSLDVVAGPDQYSGGILTAEDTPSVEEAAKVIWARCSG